MILRVVAIALFAIGVAWIAVGLGRWAGLPPAPATVDFGPGFSGSAQLPMTQIVAAFEAATERSREANSTGRVFRIAGDMSVWLAFFASAAVTLILGWYGHAPANAAPLPAGSPPPRTVSRSAVRWIGGLAAVAAVLTASGNLAQSYAERQYKRADDIESLVVESRANVKDAETADDARAVLDHLQNQSSRL